MTIEQAQTKIEEQMAMDGEFSHNIVSLVLRQIAEEHGLSAANRLVEEYQLDVAFGIEKVRGAGKRRGSHRFGRRPL